MYRCLNIECKPYSKNGLTTFPDKNEAEKGFPLQNAGRLTTLRVSNEAENGEPQLHNKRGTILFWR